VQTYRDPSGKGTRAKKSSTSVYPGPGTATMHRQQRFAACNPKRN
jgi:hypothetical protein